tara:strand:- start:2558 stop:3244 length:687 start_codon:yes stop_codon:yes gene_type:complete
MGATGFSMSIQAKDPVTFHRMFLQAARDDRLEYGNDSYSGTIGQKSGYTMVSEQPLSPSVVDKLEDERDGDKWGAALACPVAEMKEVARVSKKKKKMPFDSERVWYRGVEELLMKQTKPRKGCEVEIKVTSLVKAREPRYKLVKKESPKKWCTINRGRTTFSSDKKSAAITAYKQQLMVGLEVSLVYVDQVWERIQTHPAQWDVEYDVIHLRKTDEIAEYAVWGMAAC